MSTTTEIIDTPSTGPGVRVLLSSGEGATIKKSVLVKSTTESAVVGTGYDHDVKILGNVEAAGHGVRLGLNAGLDGMHSVYVGVNSSVTGGQTGISIYGYSSEIVNEGAISGVDAGIYFSGDSSAGRSILTNFGTVHSDTSAAIIRSGTQAFKFVNQGEITSDAEFVYLGSSATGRQMIVNSGDIDGNLLTGVGNDRYIGRGGNVDGYVWLGDGRDLYKAGDGRATKIVYGNEGEDDLRGGSSKDKLNGGEEGDALTGNGGADRFIIESHTHSTIINADFITDFSRTEGDRIDLRQIDATTLGGADDAFEFIGKAAFSGVEGELRYRFKAGHTYVEGDRNGDMTADFLIELDGKINLQAEDFLL